MRYNPCGKVCAMGRRAYKMPCRFLRDNDRIDTVYWMEADRHAEDLDRENVIVMTEQEPDGWLDYPVGEVADSPRTKTLAVAPAGSGLGHVCGNEEDFAQGGIFDEGLPAVRYGALGLPLCCAPTVRVRGGAGAGGRAGLVVEGGVTPGPSCADATEIELDTVYSGHHDGSTATFHWYKLTIPVHFIFFKIEGSSTPLNNSINLYVGTCFTVVESTSVPFGGGCGSIEGFGTLNRLLVWVAAPTGSGPFDYWFKVSVGTCP